jgi:hypothetical protein
MSTYDNGIVNAPYSSTISSLADFDLPYQLHDELFQRYGQGQFFTNVLNKMGNTFYFSNNLPLNAHEEGWAEETITTYGASTGGATAGAEVVITISPDNVDSLEQVRARVGESIYHKHTDNKVYELRITSVDDTSVSVSGSSVATSTVTLKPYNVLLTVGVGGIADGTELTIGGTAFAENTAHPGSTAKGMYRRQFYDRILKEKQTITGYEMGTDHYYTKLRNGYRSILYKAQAEKEFLLDKQVDYSFFLGETNTNSITQADEDSVNRSVKNAKGIWKWMDELSGKLTYGTSDFDFFTLDDIETYMRSQGVMSKNFMFGVGPELYKKIENGAYNFIKDFSETDMSRYFMNETGIGGANDTRSTALGLTFQCLEKNGMKFMLTPIDTFGNPKGLGNTTYDFTKSGFVIPLGNKTKVDGVGELNNISIGYNKYGGVDRKRVVKMLKGPVGMEGDIQQEYDNIKLLYLTHMMPFIMKVNQTMQVLPYDTY